MIRKFVLSALYTSYQIANWGGWRITRNPSQYSLSAFVASLQEEQEALGRGGGGGAHQGDSQA